MDHGDSPSPRFQGSSQADQPLIRIGVSAWRVAPRTQPTLMRRTIAATSDSGTPTGQAAAAAARSGASPVISEDASPKRASRHMYELARSGNRDFPMRPAATAQHPEQQ